METKNIKELISVLNGIEDVESQICEWEANTDKTVRKSISDAMNLLDGYVDFEYKYMEAKYGSVVAHKFLSAFGLVCIDGIKTEVKTITTSGSGIEIKTSEGRIRTMDEITNADRRVLALALAKLLDVMDSVSDKGESDEEDDITTIPVDTGKPVDILLTETYNPVAYRLKKKECEEQGLTEGEFEELIKYPITMEVCYSKGNGMFLVESEVIENCEIYDPYTGKKCKIEEE